MVSSLPHSAPTVPAFVTASDDKTARIWDIHLRKEVANLNGHTGKVHSANFSPDGLRIVTCVERSYRAYLGHLKTQPLQKTQKAASSKDTR